MTRVATPACPNRPVGLTYCVGKENFARGRTGRGFGLSFTNMPRVGRWLPDGRRRFARQTVDIGGLISIQRMERPGLHKAKPSARGGTSNQRDVQ